MAWIPLLLASWIVVDLVIVATVLALARRTRARKRLAPAQPAVASLRPHGAPRRQTAR